MIVSVCKNYNWGEPAKVGGLFLDSEDYLGLEFWYDRIKIEENGNG